MRHFGRAAASLNLSQPPLSRQIAALEASLGVQLVERTPRNVTLTAAGERFYQDAKGILAAIEQAGKNAQAAARGDLGELALGFTMCAAYSVVPRYASHFGISHPNVALRLREVVSNDLAPQVLAGQIDAAIVFPSASIAALAMRVVVTEPLCVALPHDHPLAKGYGTGSAAALDASGNANGQWVAQSARDSSAKSRSKKKQESCPSPLRIAELADAGFILASANASPTLRDTIIGHCQSAGFEPRIRHEVLLQQTVLSLVDEGVGVALVPASMRKAQLGRVVFRDLEDAPMIDQVLVWSPSNANPCLAQFLAMTEQAGGPHVESLPAVHLFPEN